MTASHTILVVEDDDDIRETLREVLLAEGYQVDEARDGLEAFAHLRAGGPDHVSLILLDMMMPKMDGEAFLAALKQTPDLARLRVVVISGNARARARAEELAAEGCLVKPFDLEDLLGVVHRFA